MRLLVSCILAAGLAASANQGFAQGAPRGPGREKVPPKVTKPSNPKLTLLQRQFVEGVEKLAVDYERTKKPEEAQACYEDILRLLPEYGPAQKKLEALLEKQATAQRKVMDIHANRGWQETGVLVLPGKPVRISAEGGWTFNISEKLGADGMQIPEELRDFNLGSLIGVVVGGEKPDESKPFFVGQAHEFRGEYPGKLLLRMYDSDPTDNVGKLSVEITGTYEKGQ